MKHFLERLASPLSHWSDDDLRTAVRMQVQRLVEGHHTQVNKGTKNLLTYGSTSVVELGEKSGSQQLAYAQQIEQLVRQYEPRLVNPIVQVVTPHSEHEAPYLQLQATLSLDDESELFYFRTDLDAIAGV